MRHTLQAVVNVEGRDHHKEAISVDGADERGDHEGVPGFMGVVFEGVTGVGEE